MAIALALALLVPLIGWLAVVMLRVETPNGTLLVEMNDDELEARIKNGKLILSGPDGKVRYTLSPKERSKKLEAGPVLRDYPEVAGQYEARWEMLWAESEDWKEKSTWTMKP